MDTRWWPHYSGRVFRRVLLVLVLAGLCVTPASTQSVTVLVDASYSMSIVSDGRSRLEALAIELAEWTDRQSPDVRYALLVAEHGSLVELQLPYPATARSVLSAVAGVVPFGSIDLGSAVAAAARTTAAIASAAGETSGTLLVLTDAEDLAALTGAPWAPLPANVAVEYIVPGHRGRASVATRLDRLAGRAIVPVTPMVTREADATRPDDETSSGSTEKPVAPGATIGGGSDWARLAAPERVDRPSLVVRWARLFRWLFLAGVAIGLIGFRNADARHRRRVAAVLAHNERPPVLALEIRGPSGTGEVTIDSYPARLGGGAGSLLHPDLGRTDEGFTLACEDGAIRLAAEPKVKINGIGRTEYELSERNQIRIGAVRILVRSIEHPRPMRPPRPRHRAYPLAPAAAALAAATTFLITATGTPADASAEEPVPVASSPSDDERGASRDSAARAASMVAADDRRADRAGGSAVRAGSGTGDSGSGEQSRAMLPELSLPRVFAPDDPLPQDELDFLAIHAHPDDEAIDFGALLASMSSSGLRGAVVLLTDGESGRDQYPWREIDDGYPPYDLADTGLASVRIAEARESIGWLGAGVYLRFGLPNHPYNSLEEELTPSRIVSLWGGADAVAGRIADAIDALRPRILLAPAGPSDALEHFEHEATGLLVDRALELVPRHNSPELVLRSVDPLQITTGEMLHEVPAWSVTADGTVPRLRQMLALRAHRTQRDATVIGLETRLALEHEYYTVSSGTDGSAGLLRSIGLVPVDPGIDRPYPLLLRRNE